MIKKILVIAAVGFLAACASPTFQMTPTQVSSLSDEQLCQYKNGYRAETKLEAEVSRRGLNCNRFHRECLARGNQPGTQAMDFCMDLLRENERLRYDPRYDHYDVFGYHRYSPRRSGLGMGVGF